MRPADSTLSEACGQSRFLQANSADLLPLLIGETIQRHYSRMHTLDGKPYRLFLANCEHTLKWALTGKSFSEQLSLAAVIAHGFATVATAVAVTSRA